ncbi:hypothetical protein PHET_02243 [Paragonimus heterotremus]|uniref:Uncharacterized protein n=1 Tax=Paragonimus heterotremus TaxID=100268 RepID=A0A8J4WK14_9TREM|nr:hypothetical protein PHET_02243 [Paragonimus heterotremus]
MISHSKSTISWHAAVLIQCWYRKAIARLEARRQCAWHLFRALDNSETDSQASTIEELFATLDTTQALGSSCMPLLTPDVTEEDIQFPLGQREFKYLLQMISLGKNRISLTIFSEILKQSAKVFENLPNITDIQLKENESVNVCGDLHGNLPALLQIFDQETCRRNWIVIKDL